MTRNVMRYLIVLSLLTAATVTAMARASEAADSAVILQYHRFGEAALPSTNVTLAQFDAHLAYLQTGGFTVMPVPAIIEALRKGAPLPDRTIGITIDDAALSVFTEAWPRLRNAGFPFTVFVSTDALDQGHAGIMSWDQLRTLAGAGVTIGNHGAAHAHMWRQSDAENRTDIAKAQRRIVEELGVPPTLFAYSYGEYTLELRAIAMSLGLEVAFGQQSGPIHARGDFMTLPRFALNEKYAGIDRFRMIANTLPIVATEVTPVDPVLKVNPPPFGFTIVAPTSGADNLACYASHEGKLMMERLGPDRIEVRLATPFPKGRNRINCTLPGKDGRWHWFGVQYLAPN